MDVVLPSPGRYVVAVSGGVDSMVLLHVLNTRPGLELVVAHFDHGIRNDSAEDRELVRAFAEDKSLRFVYEEGRLGAGTGEAAARDARYEFLRGVLKDTGSQSILTAHHRDDVMETAIINLLRGSGRKGLTSLGSRGDIERPFLDVPKTEIIAYAEKNGLEWREDSTNEDIDYLRNYVRPRLMPRLDGRARQRLLAIITDMRSTNSEIDGLLAEELQGQVIAGRLDRDWFIDLPHGVARETMAAWLRDNGLRDFDSKTLERLVVAAKTAEPGKTFDVMRGTGMAVDKHGLALTVAER